MTDEKTYDRTFDQTGVAPQPPTKLPDEPYYREPTATQRTNRTRLGALLLVIGVVWLAVELLGRGVLFGGALGPTTVLDRSAPGASRIELDALSADVEVRTDDGPIRVEAVQRGGRSGDYTVGFEQSGDTVRVTTGSNGGFCLFCGRDLSYTVSVPADSQVTIRTTSGDITISGLEGGEAALPDLTTVSGSIEARELSGGLKASTTSGDLDLRDVAGRLEVQTSSGEVSLQDGALSGAQVRTTSGDIDLRGALGRLELNSTSGEISVRDVRDGVLNISASSGDISYQGSLAVGSHQVSTVSGGVDLRLPEDSSLRLHATTVSGELSMEGFEGQRIEETRRELNGNVGDGAADVSVVTTSGDVEVRGE
ncbi:MAG TPA: DUF4097 family beta strand repeat-containing protein [Roseiflexaceae bacterium]|nr:DUF4097 family beta strand repeat-containing protein [Roseiflexaceae bacterium]